MMHLLKDTTEESKKAVWKSLGLFNQKLISLDMFNLSWMSKTFSIKRRNKLLTKKLQDQKLQKKMNKLKLLEVINDNLFDS